MTYEETMEELRQHNDARTSKSWAPVVQTPAKSYNTATYVNLRPISGTGFKYIKEAFRHLKAPQDKYSFVVLAVVDSVSFSEVEGDGLWLHVRPDHNQSPSGRWIRREGDPHFEIV